MNVAEMELSVQHAALAQWVAWFNGHRNEVSPQLERDLNRVLHAMDKNQVETDDLREIQLSFDDWLAALPRTI
jgi:hypothetical protein